MKTERRRYRLIVLVVLAALLLAGCTRGVLSDVAAELDADKIADEIVNGIRDEITDAFGQVDLPEPCAEEEEPVGAPGAPVGIPEYAGEAYCAINGNQPQFDDITDKAYEYYSPLDSLGRCGAAEACVGKELMPTEPRGDISRIRPTGWVNVPYDFVDGRSLYNRCHLIGFQLTGENDNERNLITGTRYMNVEGMLPFENMIADYVKETGNHVLYRVTPVFSGEELLARGVQMEAWSVEDEGEGVCFNVYAYNVQPGVIIDYATGRSEADEELINSGEQGTYVLNTNSHKFHLPSCPGAETISEKNRQEYTGSRQLLVLQGYKPCTQCNP